MPDESISAVVESKLREVRIAHLATVDPSGRPHVVPICFIYDYPAFYTALDQKPKRVSPAKLARVRNIEANPDVMLLVDHYDENWDRLWYIQVRGKAKLLPNSAQAERAHAIQLLRTKYAQYSAGMLPDDAPMIRITPEQIVSWGTLL